MRNNVSWSLADYSVIAMLLFVASLAASMLME